MKNIYEWKMQLRLLRASLIISLCAISLCSYSQVQLTLEPAITSGLSEPIQFVNAGDGSNRIFIVQKGGSIRVYNSSYNYLATFLTLSDISTSGEQGLLSVAFHPQYASNGFFYVYYVNGAGNLELARFKVSNTDANVAEASSKVVLITIPHPGNSNHNGGEMHFGKDGYLYLSTGDGGGGGDAPNNAQNTSVLLGKILRFNVNTSLSSPYYTVPADNPYANEIFNIGLRNPFRWSFDRLTGDMWIGDVGQDSWEEINFRAAASLSNTNYGWRCYEGNTTYNTSNCGDASSYVFPVHTYATQNPSAAITGGVVYRGNIYTSLQGCYVAADFYSGTFYKIRSNGSGGWNITTQSLSPTGIADFGEAENGEIYAVSLTSGAVYHIASDGPLPTKLTTFNAQPTQNGIQLNWKTASEIAIRQFDLEYSYQGNVFMHLASVAPQNHAEGSSYNYLDKAFYNDDVFYRLKTTDNDGSVSYSGVIRVSPEIDKKTTGIFPTIVKDGYIHLHVKNTGYHTLELASSNGQLVLKSNLNGEKGKVSILLPSLTPGLYIAKISGATDGFTQKVIIE